MESYFMAKRNHKSDELDTDMPASHLLKIIAKRAKRTDTFNIHNLKKGEAFLGDYSDYGMSRRQYRTAKEKLEKWGFATFKTTNKGTIATLTDTSIYDINIEDVGQQNDTQEANNRPATGQQPATNNNDKNVKNVKNDKKLTTFCPTSEEVRLSELLLSLILGRKSDYKKPNIQLWAKHIDLMIRLDHRKPEAIEKVIRWAATDSFWQNNILSTEKLRKQFDKLDLKASAINNRQNLGMEHSAFGKEYKND
jgi:hypothetical protein